MQYMLRIQEMREKLRGNGIRYEEATRKQSLLIISMVAAASIALGTVCALAPLFIQHCILAPYGVIMFYGLFLACVMKVISICNFSSKYGNFCLEQAQSWRELELSGVDEGAARLRESELHDRYKQKVAEIETESRHEILLAVFAGMLILFVAALFWMVI